MENKKESKPKKKIKGLKYFVLGAVFILCVVNFVLLIQIKNNLYDTFYVNDVYFVYNPDNTYTLSFEAVSAQNKAYDIDDILYFHFNCYDGNGALIDGNVQVEMNGTQIGPYMFFNSDEGKITLVTSDKIKYCELNYAEIYNSNNTRIIN